MAQIIVVDDEMHIAELIKFNLEKDGHRVTTVTDGLEGLKAIKEMKPDLVILDVMLPGMDGLTICQNLRRQDNYSDIAIIMLTAKGELLDKVLGLEMGADDYITKPFSPRELMARVKAKLRRELPKTATNEAIINAGQIRINSERFDAYIGEKKLELTLKEFELLRLLTASAGKVFTRDFLLERIWGFDCSCDTRTVDVHIHHLRQKLEEEPGTPQMIKTVRGVGYKFELDFPNTGTN